MSVSEVNSSSWNFEWFSKEDPLEAKKEELLQKLKDSAISLQETQEELQFVRELINTLRLPALFPNNEDRERLLQNTALEQMIRPLIDGLNRVRDFQQALEESKKEIQQASDWEGVKEAQEGVDDFKRAIKKATKCLTACANGFARWTTTDWEKISEIFAEQNKHFADIFLLRHMVAVEEALPDNLYFPTRQLPKSQKPTNPLATHSIYANLAVNNLFLNQL
jgi:uncharacterized membrane-anchored protein YjiN (DUF445 family)